MRTPTILPLPSPKSISPPPPRDDVLSDSFSDDTLSDREYAHRSAVHARRTASDMGSEVRRSKSHYRKYKKRISGHEVGHESLDNVHRFPSETDIFRSSSGDKPRLKKSKSNKIDYRTDHTVHRARRTRDYFQDLDQHLNG